MSQSHRHLPGDRRNKPHRARTSRLGCEGLEQRRVLAASLVLSGPTTAVLEGERATFTLQLSERLKTAETVTISTVPGTATYGTDYFAPSATTLLFGPGQQSKSFTIPLLRDQLKDQAEGIETFQVVVTPANRSLGVKTATVRIADYVALPSITVTGGSVTEGNSGSTPLNFTVSLSAAYPKPVTVSYATRDDSATVGDRDYQAASGTLTFNPGELTKTVAVQVNGDDIAEYDESFSLVLSAPTNARLGTATATGRIVNDELDQPGFQISIEYVTSFYGQVPPAVRTATEQAVARWQRVITGDLPGLLEESTGRYVDDFRMRVQMGLLGGGSDGGSGALANAMPVQYRTGTSGLPWLGDTGIDPADVANPQLVGILTHEIGHALGFAPGNAIFDRWVTGTNWTGTNALREYRTLARSSTPTGVPLETGGGGGTAGAHWSEATFGTELMTGYAEPAGVAMPLSRLTVAAFADMGYTVNYAAADTYSLPAVPIRAPVGTPNSSVPTGAGSTRRTRMSISQGGPSTPGNSSGYASAPQSVGIGRDAVAQTAAPVSAGRPSMVGRGTPTFPSRSLAFASLAGRS